MAEPSVPGVVRIGLVQMQCEEDPERNLAEALARIAEAKELGAKIVCLPELFRSRYFCQTEDHDKFDLAEPIPGPTSDALAAAARKHEVVLIGSIFERRAAGVYHNSACVYDADGSLVGLYRKMHIPDDPLYHEKFYFTPGDLGFRAFPTRYGKIGVLVCWDQWFPEAARLTALQGAEILFYPTAIGWHDEEKAEHGDGQHDAWQTVQRGHAVANGVYVAAPNRVGQEGTVEFWGGSFVSGPFGDVMATAGHESAEVLIADCDLARVEEVRRHWPFLRDRRVDAYRGITRHFLDD
ncbi:MAG: carbon-nitrogen hydrolase [Candidatus Binatia bacterium]|nr:carbon-nitrogen hydrolase [Candidatus Binatia bacterium]